MTWKNRSKEEKRAYRFGISVEALRSLLARDKCDLCGCLSPKTELGWHIDHNHHTGQVRGILCHPCNVVVLPIIENVDVLSRALAYLRDPPGIRFEEDPLP